MTGRALLSRRGLARVLQSLLLSELAAARGSRTGAREQAAGPWPDEFKLAGDGPASLGCDSLETLRLASAVNEMFHLYEAHREADLPAASTFGAWLDGIEAGWRDGIDRLTFATSGSTGAPKLCTHSFDDLRIELGFLSELFGTRRRIVALAPAHHIYGLLFTAGLADRLDVGVLEAERIGPGALTRDLRPGDLVVSFPERWAWLDRSLPAWPADVEGVTSTAPCDPALKTSLLGRGLGGFTEIYGSSETAGVAVRRWPASAYALMPHWHLETASPGEPPVLVHRSGARKALQDRIDLRPDGTFEVAGRLDGGVQVGGTNVFPDRVAEKLRQQPGVAAAAVRLMRQDEGARLKAFLVAMPGVPEGAVRERVERWIEQALPACERPRRITFGPRLPTTPLGKPADW